MRRLVALTALIVLIPTFGVHAQSPQVTFTEDLAVGGTVTTGGGIVFPDGTVQTTTAGGIGDSSLTANGGLYSNRIIEFAPPLPYVEVCFKNGGFTFDIHTGNSESTTGGNCEPGDKGWVIERDERAATYWNEARAECLMHDMRLPEPFEYGFSCRRDSILALIGMTGNWEWASNATKPTYMYVPDNSKTGLSAATIGSSNCSSSALGIPGRNDGVASQRTFRCVR